MVRKGEKEILVAGWLACVPVETETIDEAVHIYTYTLVQTIVIMNSHIVIAIFRT